MPSRRLQIALMREILEVRSARLVDLQRFTRTAPNQLLRSLSLLVASGLLKVDQATPSSSKIYVITPKGERALSKIREALEMLAPLLPSRDARN